MRTTQGFSGQNRRMRSEKASMNPFFSVGSHSCEPTPSPSRWLPLCGPPGQVGVHQASGNGHGGVCGSL